MTLEHQRTHCAAQEPERIALAALDGYPITAIKYAAHSASGMRPRGQIIVAGATGVPQLFYRQFALYAAAQGYTTLTLDYRGIGLSKPASLKGFRMHLLDWARFDLAAAVDLMAQDPLPLHMVGHSFGGHAFGLLPNHRLVTSLYTFGTGAGWHGWMPRAEQWRVQLMWRVLGPLITRWKGYLAWSLLGMGEDLPLGVYTDWKRWCSYPHYFFDDPAMLEISDYFDSVSTPIVAANALDDAWASPASRDAFMAGYRHADWQGININAQEHGLAEIGHMGYFRRPAKPLWADVLQWFQLKQTTNPLTQPPAAMAPRPTNASTAFA